MDRKIIKADQQRLLDQLRKSGSSEVGIFRDLLQLMHEDAKMRLVDASPDEFAKIQGEAKAYDKFYRELMQPASLDQGADL